MHVCKFNSLGWDLRKAAATKTNVRMVMVAIVSLTSIACTEAYLPLKAFAFLSIGLENKSTRGHQ